MDYWTKKQRYWRNFEKQQKLVILLQISLHTVLLFKTQNSENSFKYLGSIPSGLVVLYLNKISLKQNQRILSISYSACIIKDWLCAVCTWNKKKIHFRKLSHLDTLNRFNPFHLIWRKASFHMTHKVAVFGCAINVIFFFLALSKGHYRFNLLHSNSCDQQ